MYWDSLPDMVKLTGSNSKWASTLISQHLLAAADRYGLDRLRLLCEAILCEQVAINTVATTLALAEQHHCFQLKSVCLKFVAMPENLRGNCTVSLVQKTLTLSWWNNLIQKKTEYLKFLPYFFHTAVMQSEGFEYLKESCPSVLTELLEHVARVTEHSLASGKQGIGDIMDRIEGNSRRVKQRL